MPARPYTAGTSRTEGNGRSGTAARAQPGSDNALAEQRGGSALAPHPEFFTPHSSCLYGGGRNLEEAVGILCNALVTHLEMHMRPGGAAGGSGFGDDRAALHQVAGLDQQLGIMRVAGGEVVA